MQNDVTEELFDATRKKLPYIEPDRSINQICSRLWEHIVSHRYDFDTKLQYKKVLEKVTKQDLIVRHILLKLTPFLL